VFSFSSLASIDWQQQIKVNPTTFQSSEPQYTGESLPHPTHHRRSGAASSTYAARNKAVSPKFPLSMSGK
jgi:hypothetical protein